MAGMTKYVRRAIAMALPAALLAACGMLPGFGPTPIPTSPFPLTETQLKYRLIEAFGEVFFCDPDFYPVARDDEAKLAIERFPEIQADPEEFQAILTWLGWTPKASFSTEEKLAIYREHKRLAAILLEPAGPAFRFSMRAIEGEEIHALEGEIDRLGEIRLTSRTPSSDMCPICLPASAWIDTPGGPIRVGALRQGDLIWSLAGDGRRIAAPVLLMALNPAPHGHTMIRLGLSDGRSILASAGHPTADGRRLSDLRPGHSLDGARVVVIETIGYPGEFTFDLLPEGDTGAYWADGVLLRSSLWEP